eukprot:gene615-594_t
MCAAGVQRGSCALPAVVDMSCVASTPPLHPAAPPLDSGDSSGTSSTGKLERVEQ